MPRRGWVERRLPTFTAAGRWLKARVAGGVRYSAAAFAGAVTNRLTDWVFAPLRSADDELRSELQVLRRRARDLGRNNSYASRFLGLLEENVVGPHGIKMQARVVDSNGVQNEEVNRRIESAWTEWGQDPFNCSVDGRLTWVEIKALAVITMAQDGEYLIRIHEGFDNEFGFALQVLDPDQLPTDLNRSRRNGQNAIRMGVEVNRWGRPVAYHLYRGHPHDVFGGIDTRETERVPAEDIIHDFVSRRPGQSRGVTWFTPVMTDVHQLGGLQEAELIGSRVAASKGGFFEQDIEEGSIPDPNVVNAGPTRIQMKVEPGLFDTLPPGLTFKPWDPQHPNSAFEGFNTVILRSISTGLRSSYHSMTGDLTKMSFSSGRLGVEQDRHVWRCIQQRLINHLCRRVRQRWMKMAVTTRKLTLPSFDLDKWSAHEWQPRSWGYVDPLKDVLAVEKEIELGINSRTRAAAERGRDFNENLAELEREEGAIQKSGVPLTLPGSDAAALQALAEMSEDEYADFIPKGLTGRVLNTNGNGAHAR